jgi:hypothetical protein
MSRIRILSTSLVFALAACGGDSGTGPDDMDPSGNGGGGTTTRVVKANPSFGSDIQEIFTRKGCAASSCHGASAQAGLSLTTGNAYGNLVSVTATQSALFRVAPGDPANSYLVMKVEGSAAFGARMPLGGSALDNIDIQNLKNWISSGAMNN